MALVLGEVQGTPVRTQNIQEASAQLEDFLLVKILTHGDAENQLTLISLHHDGEFFLVEEKMVYFLYGITEVEIPKYPETEETA